MKKKITIRSPNGFRATYTVHKYNNKIEYVYCKLYDTTKTPAMYVGNAELERAYGKVYKTHSNINSDYHKRGLGTLLYAKVIAWGFNHGFKVQSSGDSSDMAKRVWEGRGIRKYFNIEKTVDTNYKNEDIETWYPSRKRKRK